MATRLYLRTEAPANDPGTTSRSGVLPVANGADYGLAVKSLEIAKGAAQAASEGTSQNITAHADEFFTSFSGPALTAENISVQTWTIALCLHEGNGAANSYMALCLYVFREPGTVVGFIYDSDTALGAEWTNQAGGRGRLATFSGAAVTGVQAGDYIVLEVWRHTPGQTMSTAYPQHIHYNGTVDVTEDDVTGDAASYLETPQDITWPTTDFPLTLDPGSYALAGLPGTDLLAGYYMNAVVDSYALAGLDASPLFGAYLNAVVESYALAGLDVSPLKGSYLNGEPDSYALAGLDASPLFGAYLNGEPSSYALAGLDLTVLKDSLLNLDPDSYALAGLDANLEAGYLLNGDAGGYNLTGVLADLLVGYYLNGEAGAYAVAELDALVLAGILLSLDPGSYAYTGLLTDFERGYLMDALAGSYGIFQLVER